MSKIQMAKTNPRSIKEAEIIQEGNAVVLSMTGNANFSGTATTALLTAFKTDFDTYKAAVTAAGDGGKALNKAKRAAKAIFLIRWKALANNVNDVVKALNLTKEEIEAKIATSGFPLIDTNHTAHPVEKPVNLRAFYPKAGVLVVRVNKVKNARTYNWLYRENGSTGPWLTLDKYKTKTKVTLLTQEDNISSGKKYDFQVIAQGADPSENASDILVTDFIR